MHVHTIQIWIRIPSEVEKKLLFSVSRSFDRAHRMRIYGFSTDNGISVGVSLPLSFAITVSRQRQPSNVAIVWVRVCACKNVLFLMALSTPLYRTSGDRYHAFRNSTKYCYFRAVNREKKRKCVCAYLIWNCYCCCCCCCFDALFFSLSRWVIGAKTPSLGLSHSLLSSAQHTVCAQFLANNQDNVIENISKRSNKNARTRTPQTHTHTHLKPCTHSEIQISRKK